MDKAIEPDFNSPRLERIAIDGVIIVFACSRVAHAEMLRVRKLISGTGRADLLATAELAHCAARVASLVLEACGGFEALRSDATATQIAYADYLQGRGGAPVAQSPEAPLSRLLTAAVLFQKGQASPSSIQVAIDTASAQGWRRVPAASLCRGGAHRRRIKIYRNSP